MARKRRRHQHEESEQHERWMVSYADFITLLFAFFVVMYSISSVNEGKYKILNTSIAEAFQPTENKPVEVLTPVDNLSSELIQPIKLDTPGLPVDQNTALSAELAKERQKLGDVSSQFEAVLQESIDQNLVQVKKNDFWIELEMNSELLFLSGEAEVSKRALPILAKIAEVLKPLPYMINVEGYTDNVPINTVQFPSNWDLASARATSVVKALVQEQVNPDRLAAVGYGEFHHVADNDTETGRFKNRRVVLLVMSQVIARYGTTENTRAKMLNIEAPSLVLP